MEYEEYKEYDASTSIFDRLFELEEKINKIETWKNRLMYEAELKSERYD